MSIAPSESGLGVIESVSTQSSGADPAAEAGRRTASHAPDSARSTAVADDDEPTYVEDGDDPAPVKKKPKRPSTAQFKFVPETLALRERIKAAAEEYARSMDKAKPFTKAELEVHGRKLLEQMGQPDRFLGFTMVMLGNFFWRRQFLSVPFSRRMLLLPHCLKHAEGCPAEYDEFGLDCERCGACSIADYKVRAEQLGYKVLVAEGSPIVLKIIVAGHVDGVLGVACLNVLEKAIDKVLIAGVPSYAVPLHSGDCKNTTLDESWVWECLDKYEPLAEPETTSWVPLMRAANALFDERFDELLPRIRSRTPETALSPLGRTEDLSYDWLRNGGKRFRPFITLAAYDAMTGGKALQSVGDAAPVRFSDAVSRTAMAIEAFHKASLVHDDIEDGDRYRYGRETLHRSHGTGLAINVGDHLIGLGYRLLGAARAEFGAEVAADIQDRMSQAHIRLCDGQGAEMVWQNEPDRQLSPLDALQIYALKTSPAFEAALYAGLRMAGTVEKYEELIPAFSRHLGVGFQILNDLKDWQGDADNKLVAGQDALSLRPTLLLALAWQNATAEQKAAISACCRLEGAPGPRIERLKRLFDECGAFDAARALVDKSRARAEALADDVEPDALRQLLYFFVDTMLAPEETDDGPPIPTAVLVSLES